MQSLLLATLVLSVSLCALAPQSPSQAAAPETVCPNPLVREPVLLYEVTGGTLTGPFDLFLSVYNDGSARLSSALDGGGLGSSQYVGVDPLEVVALRQALLAAGASSECDQPFPTSDTPLQTLTLFRSGSRRASTFSWFTSDGELALIQSLLEGFMAAHFTPLGGGSGW